MKNLIFKEVSDTGYFQMVAVASHAMTMQIVLYEQWLLPHLKKKNLYYTEPGITPLYLKDLPLSQNLNDYLMYIIFLFSLSFLNII